MPLVSLSSSQWLHNERGCVSNHRRLDCLLKPLFRRKSNKTSKFRWNPPLAGGFASQRITDAENVSIWWRHRVFLYEGVFCENNISLSLPNRFHNSLLEGHVAKRLDGAIRQKQTNNLRISETRFPHLFLNYYQKMGSVMAITWRVMDDLGSGPHTPFIIYIQ